MYKIAFGKHIDIGRNIGFTISARHANLASTVPPHAVASKLYEPNKRIT